MTADGLVDVHLLQVPVAIWGKTQEHSDELFREFALIASGGSPGSVPARLTELVETLNATYAGVSSEQERQLFEAAAAGVPEIEDLAFQVPAAAGEAAVALGQLMDEADEYCRTGEHLLTLTSPPDQLRFRRWYLDQFVTQIAGAPPVPWPEYESA